MTTFGDDLYCKNLHYDFLKPSGGETPPGAPQNLQSVLNEGSTAATGSITLTGTGGTGGTLTTGTGGTQTGTTLTAAGAITASGTITGKGNLALTGTGTAAEFSATTITADSGAAKVVTPLLENGTGTDLECKAAGTLNLNGTTAVLINSKVPLLKPSFTDLGDGTGANDTVPTGVTAFKLKIGPITGKTQSTDLKFTDAVDLWGYRDTDQSGRPSGAATHYVTLSVHFTDTSNAQIGFSGTDMTAASFPVASAADAAKFNQSLKIYRQEVGTGSNLDGDMLVYVQLYSIA